VDDKRQTEVKDSGHMGKRLHFAGVRGTSAVRQGKQGDGGV